MNVSQRLDGELLSYNITTEKMLANNTCDPLAPKDYDFMHVVYNIVIPTISLIGILGNVLNLAVLTHRSWRKFGPIEVYANAGLVALACSDIAVCIFSFIGIFSQMKLNGNQRPEYIDFQLFYSAYNSFFINTFIGASALFTTCLAVGRYLAIIFPIETRARINKSSFIYTVAGVVITSVSFNVPRLWFFSVGQCQLNGKTYYQLNKGYLHSDTTTDEEFYRYLIYNCVYFVCIMLIPLTLLAFCNFQIISHLRKHRDLPVSTSQKSSRIMTTILVSLVVMHIVFVTPAEVTTFVSQVKKSINQERNYTILVGIVNILEITNFSFNFLLYCSLNVHFRLIIKSFIHEVLKSCGYEHARNEEIANEMNQLCPTKRDNTPSPLLL